MIPLNPIRPGDTIGIVAPASPFEREKFEFGIEFLKDRGFRIYVPDEIFHRIGYLSGPDAQRARLINQMFADPDIHAIWAARGGYGSLRILPLINYSSICANPKPFVGSSDITALLTALHERCHMPVFHGPMVISFADADEATRSAAWKIFNPTDGWRVKADPRGIIRAGRASGRVTGGNLTTLSHLIGTPFEPDFTGGLLFIEDISEATYRIDRMLTQMKLAGRLSRVNGVIMGNFRDCGKPEDIIGIVETIFSDPSTPILAGIPAGHGQSNVMMPMGVEATLDADQGMLTYHSGFFNNNA